MLPNEDFRRPNKHFRTRGTVLRAISIPCQGPDNVHRAHIDQPARGVGKIVVWEG